MTPIRCTQTPTSARLFVQLATQQPRSSVLYFLSPSRTAARITTSQVGRRYGSSAHDGLQYSVLGETAVWSAGVTPRFPARRRRREMLPAQRRGATTQAIYNPQKDEEGNEMALEITPRAAQRLSEIMAKDANPYLALRVQVESGGCHGFQYLMSLVTLPAELPPPGSEAGGVSRAGVREDDTVFVYADGGQTGMEAPKIVLDAPSLELLKGSKVDFTMELIGSQFKIVDNPLATSSCGCGTSFDIKF